MLTNKVLTVNLFQEKTLSLLYRGEARMLSEIKYALRVNGVNFDDSQVVVEQLPADAKLIQKTATLMRRSVFRALQNSSNENAESLGFALAPGFLNQLSSLPPNSSASDPSLLPSQHLVPSDSVAWPQFPTTEAYRMAATLALARFVEKELGCDPAEVCSLHDTSGLCPHDLLSPRFLVRLLRYAHSHKYIFDELRRDLPVSGMTGTLHDRMLRTSIRGKLQAKTGTLTREDGITSLSGFTRGSNGHLLFFSIIQNEYPVYDARRWQDRFCEQMVR